jgi:hypothetical protein
LATWWVAKAEQAEAERDALRGTVDALRTEAGKAAFALSNGWPLPEEMAALQARVRELEALRPRLSTEDEARALMGDGQPLVKMREIK